MYLMPAKMVKMDVGDSNKNAALMSQIWMDWTSLFPKRSGGESFGSGGVLAERRYGGGLLSSARKSPSESHQTMSQYDWI
jgi:hypothetical protein